ncbi:endo-1,4-beta-xylanase 3-like [Phragmites australis]|uniref:endo-1,4-beta-xylanase 3-like n=1 Tax=Phragmites australis TaxID=29695 RepID=UPI002D784ED6|nr:endo-1,4-beta-xylanase 3-like [Phragmites australis]
MAFAEETHLAMDLIEHCVSEDGLAGWAPSGSCTLSAQHDDSAPDAVLSLAATADDDTDERARKPSGWYVLASRRAGETDGLCREISCAPRPKITYRVAGWVGLGSGAEGCHPVHVEVCVGDDQRVGGGVVVAKAGKWGEIKGSFRIDEDEPPRCAKVYVHGPPAGVDLKVMDLQVCAVNKIPRLRHLRKKTDKVRKRDVILKFSRRTDAAASAAGAEISVLQVQNSFPIGSCITKAGIQNPAYVDFFAKHFDWAVLENELKWYYTEAVQGQVRYADADELIDFCDRYGKPVRGHCIFWAVENSVQPWVRALNADQLGAAVEARLRGLVSRYSGRFPHYEVNNEMLHGAFFQQRLGDDINAHMFRETARIDPAPALFVNDYNVESANDPNATPEKYVALITDLQKRGATVGGIGIQGHVTHPVGDVICDALDKLSVTGLPIWITELDVSAADEAVRADDLEIVLREAFAHPAVEGIMLWGFMQGHMWRSHGQLVDADGKYTEAGNRFAGLRREWMSHAMGKVDSSGHFRFRGFHGTYQVTLKTGAGEVKKHTFDVSKGGAPLVLDMDF